ncbi:MAG: glucoamylase family protein [Elusimicrobiota bacterium]
MWDLIRGLSGPLHLFQPLYNWWFGDRYADYLGEKRANEVFRAALHRAVIQELSKTSDGALQFYAANYQKSKNEAEHLLTGDKDFEKLEAQYKKTIRVIHKSSWKLTNWQLGNDNEENVDQGLISAFLRIYILDNLGKLPGLNRIAFFKSRFAVFQENYQEFRRLAEERLGELKGTGNYEVYLNLIKEMERSVYKAEREYTSILKGTISSKFKTFGGGYVYDFVHIVGAPVIGLASYLRQRLKLAVYSALGLGVSASLTAILPWGSGTFILGISLAATPVIVLLLLGLLGGFLTYQGYKSKQQNKYSKILGYSLLAIAGVGLLGFGLNPLGAQALFNGVMTTLQVSSTSTGGFGLYRAIGSVLLAAIEVVSVQSLLSAGILATFLGLQPAMTEYKNKQLDEDKKLNPFRDDQGWRGPELKSLDVREMDKFIDEVNQQDLSAEQLNKVYHKLEENLIYNTIRYHHEAELVAISLKLERLYQKIQGKSGKNLALAARADIVKEQQEIKSKMLKYYLDGFKITLKDKNFWKKTSGSTLGIAFVNAEIALAIGMGGVFGGVTDTQALESSITFFEHTVLGSGQLALAEIESVGQEGNSTNISDVMYHIAGGNQSWSAQEAVSYAKLKAEYQASTNLGMEKKALELGINIDQKTKEIKNEIGKNAGRENGQPEYITLMPDIAEKDQELAKHIWLKAQIEALEVRQKEAEASPEKEPESAPATTTIPEKSIGGAPPPPPGSKIGYEERDYPDFTRVISFVTYSQAVNGTDGAYLTVRTDPQTNQLYWEKVEHTIPQGSSLDSSVSVPKLVNLDGSKAGEKEGIISSVRINGPVKQDQDGKAYYETKWGPKELDISYKDYIKALNDITEKAGEITLRNDPSHAKYRIKTFTQHTGDIIIENGYPIPWNQVAEIYDQAGKALTDNYIPLADMKYAGQGWVDKTSKYQMTGKAWNEELDKNLKKVESARKYPTVTPAAPPIKAEATITPKEESSPDDTSAPEETGGEIFRDLNEDGVRIFRKDYDQSISIYNYPPDGGYVLFLNKIHGNELYWLKEVHNKDGGTTSSLVNYDGSEHKTDTGLIVGKGKIALMQKDLKTGLAFYQDQNSQARNPDGSIFSFDQADLQAVKYEDYIEGIKDFTQQAKYVSFPEGTEKYPVKFFFEAGVVVNIGGNNMFVPAYPDLMKFYDENSEELAGEYIPPKDWRTLDGEWRKQTWASMNSIVPAKVSGSDFKSVEDMPGAKSLKESAGKKKSGEATVEKNEAVLTGGAEAVKKIMDTGKSLEDEKEENGFVEIVGEFATTVVNYTGLAALNISAANITIPPLAAYNGTVSVIVNQTFNPLEMVEATRITGIINDNPNLKEPITTYLTHSNMSLSDFGQGQEFVSYLSAQKNDNQLTPEQTATAISMTFQLADTLNQYEGHTKYDLNKIDDFKLLFAQAVETLKNGGAVDKNFLKDTNDKKISVSEVISSEKVIGIDMTDDYRVLAGKTINFELPSVDNSGVPLTYQTLWSDHSTLNSVNGEINWDTKNVNPGSYTVYLEATTSDGQKVGFDLIISVIPEKYETTNKENEIAVKVGNNKVIFRFTGKEDIVKGVPVQTRTQGYESAEPKNELDHRSHTYSLITTRTNGYEKGYEKNVYSSKYALENKIADSLLQRWNLTSTMIPLTMQDFANDQYSVFENQGQKQYIYADKKEADADGSRKQYRESYALEKGTGKLIEGERYGQFENLNNRQKVSFVKISKYDAGYVEKEYENNHSVGDGQELKVTFLDKDFVPSRSENKIDGRVSLYKAIKIGTVIRGYEVTIYKNDTDAQDKVNAMEVWTLDKQQKPLNAIFYNEYGNIDRVEVYKETTGGYTKEVSYGTDATVREVWELDNKLVPKKATIYGVDGKTVERVEIYTLTASGYTKEVSYGTNPTVREVWELDNKLVPKKATIYGVDGKTVERVEIYTQTASGYTKEVSYGTDATVREVWELDSKLVPKKATIYGVDGKTVERVEIYTQTASGYTKEVSYGTNPTVREVWELDSKLVPKKATIYNVNGYDSASPDKNIDRVEVYKESAGGYTKEVSYGDNLKVVREVWELNSKLVPEKVTFYNKSGLVAGDESLNIERIEVYTEIKGIGYEKKLYKNLDDFNSNKVKEIWILDKKLAPKEAWIYKEAWEVTNHLNPDGTVKKDIDPENIRSIEIYAPEIVNNKATGNLVKLVYDSLDSYHDGKWKEKWVVSKDLMPISVEYADGGEPILFAELKSAAEKFYGPLNSEDPDTWGILKSWADYMHTNHKSMDYMGTFFQNLADILPEWGEFKGKDKDDPGLLDPKKLSPDDIGDLVSWVKFMDEEGYSVEEMKDFFLLMGTVKEKIRSLYNPKLPSGEDELTIGDISYWAKFVKVYSVDKDGHKDYNKEKILLDNLYSIVKERGFKTHYYQDMIDLQGNKIMEEKFNFQSKDPVEKNYINFVDKDDFIVVYDGATGRIEDSEEFKNIDPFVKAKADKEKSHVVIVINEVRKFPGQNKSEIARHYDKLGDTKYHLQYTSSEEGLTEYTFKEKLEEIPVYTVKDGVTVFEYQPKYDNRLAKLKYLTKTNKLTGDTFTDFYDPMQTAYLGEQYSAAEGKTKIYNYNFAWNEWETDKYAIVPKPGYESLSPINQHILVTVTDKDSGKVLEEHKDFTFDPAGLLKGEKIVDKTMKNPTKFRTYALNGDVDQDLAGNNHIDYYQNGVYNHTTNLNGDTVKSVTYQTIEMNSEWQNGPPVKLINQRLVKYPTESRTVWESRNVLGNYFISDETIGGVEKGYDYYPNTIDLSGGNVLKTVSENGVVKEDHSFPGKYSEKTVDGYTVVNPEYEIVTYPEQIKSGLLLHFTPEHALDWSLTENQITYLGDQEKYGQLNLPTKVVEYGTGRELYNYTHTIDPEWNVAKDTVEKNLLNGNTRTSHYDLFNTPYETAYTVGNEKFWHKLSGKALDPRDLLQEGSPAEKLNYDAMKPAEVMARSENFFAAEIENNWNYWKEATPKTPSAKAYPLPYDSIRIGMNGDVVVDQEQTSPETIGWYLQSIVASYSLGEIDKDEAVKRVKDVLTDLKKLDKYDGESIDSRKGHLFSAYDPETLEPILQNGKLEIDTKSSVPLDTGLYLVKSVFGDDKEIKDLTGDLISGKDYGDIFDGAKNQFPEKIILTVEDEKVTGTKFSEQYYNLKYSDSRMLYWIASSRGEVPKAAWENLKVDFGTTQYKEYYNGKEHQVVIAQSQTGGGKEALLPSLYINEQELDEAGLGLNNLWTVELQKRTAKSEKTPVWGITPVFDPIRGEYRTDLGIAYAGEAENHGSQGIISPAVSYLALNTDPVGASANLMKMRQLYPNLYRTGLGLADSVNVKENVAANIYTAENKGIALVAIANMQQDGAIQKAFKEGLGSEFGNIEKAVQIQTNGEMSLIEPITPPTASDIDKAKEKIASEPVVAPAPVEKAPDEIGQRLILKTLNEKEEIIKDYLYEFFASGLVNKITTIDKETPDNARSVATLKENGDLENVINPNKGNETYTDGRITYIDNSAGNRIDEQFIYPKQAIPFEFGGRKFEVAVSRLGTKNYFDASAKTVLTENVKYRQDGSVVFLGKFSVNGKTEETVYHHAIDMQTIGNGLKSPDGDGLSGGIEFPVNDGSGNRYLYTVDYKENTVSYLTKNSRGEAVEASKIRLPFVQLKEIEDLVNQVNAADNEETRNAFSSQLKAKLLELQAQGSEASYSQSYRDEEGNWVEQQLDFEHLIASVIKTPRNQDKESTAVRYFTAEDSGKLKPMLDNKNLEKDFIRENGRIPDMAISAQVTENGEWEIAVAHNLGKWQEFGQYDNRLTKNFFKSNKVTFDGALISEMAAVGEDGKFLQGADGNPYVLKNEFVNIYGQKVRTQITTLAWISGLEKSSQLLAGDGQTVLEKTEKKETSEGSYEERRQFSQGKETSFENNSLPYYNYKGIAFSGSRIDHYFDGDNQFEVVTEWGKAPEFDLTREPSVTEKITAFAGGVLDKVFKTAKGKEEVVSVAVPEQPGTGLQDKHIIKKSRETGKVVEDSWFRMINGDWEIIQQTKDDGTHTIVEFKDGRKTRLFNAYLDRDIEKRTVMKYSVEEFQYEDVQINGDVQRYLPAKIKPTGIIKGTVYELPDGFKGKKGRLAGENYYDSHVQKWILLFGSRTISDINTLFLDTKYVFVRMDQSNGTDKQFTYQPGFLGLLNNYYYWIINRGSSIPEPTSIDIHNHEGASIRKINLKEGGTVTDFTASRDGSISGNTGKLPAGEINSQFNYNETTPVEKRSWLWFEISGQEKYTKYYIPVINYFPDRLALITPIIAGAIFVVYRFIKVRKRKTAAKRAEAAVSDGIANRAKQEGVEWIFTEPKKDAREVRARIDAYLENNCREEFKELSREIVAHVHDTPYTDADLEGTHLKFKAMQTARKLKEIAMRDVYSVSGIWELEAKIAVLEEEINKISDVLFRNPPAVTPEKLAQIARMEEMIGHLQEENKQIKHYIDKQLIKGVVALKPDLNLPEKDAENSKNLEKIWKKYNPDAKENADKGYFKVSKFLLEEYIDKMDTSFGQCKKSIDEQKEKTDSIKEHKQDVRLMILDIKALLDEYKNEKAEPAALEERRSYILKEYINQNLTEDGIKDLESAGNKVKELQAQLDKYEAEETAILEEVVDVSAIIPGLEALPSLVRENIKAEITRLQADNNKLKFKDVQSIMEKLKGLRLSIKSEQHRVFYLAEFYQNKEKKIDRLKSFLSEYTLDGAEIPPSIVETDSFNSYKDHLRYFQHIVPLLFVVWGLVNPLVALLLYPVMHFTVWAVSHNYSFTIVPGSINFYLLNGLMLVVSFFLWAYGSVVVAIVFSPLIVGFIYYWIYVWGRNYGLFKGNKVKGHRRWSPDRMKKYFEDYKKTTGQKFPLMLLLPKRTDLAPEWPQALYYMDQNLSGMATFLQYYGEYVQLSFFYNSGTNTAKLQEEEERGIERLRQKFEYVEKNPIYIVYVRVNQKGYGKKMGDLAAGDLFSTLGFTMPSSYTDKRKVHEVRPQQPLFDKIVGNFQALYQIKETEDWRNVIRLAYEKGQNLVLVNNVSIDFWDNSKNERISETRLKKIIEFLEANASRDNKEIKDIEPADKPSEVSILNKNKKYFVINSRKLDSAQDVSEAIKGGEQVRNNLAAIPPIYVTMDDKNAFPPFEIEKALAIMLENPHISMLGKNIYMSNPVDLETFSGPAVLTSPFYELSSSARQANLQGEALQKMWMMNQAGIFFGKGTVRMHRNQPEILGLIEAIYSYYREKKPADLEEIARKFGEINTMIENDVYQSRFSEEDKKFIANIREAFNQNGENDVKMFIFYYNNRELIKKTHTGMFADEVFNVLFSLSHDGLEATYSHTEHAGGANDIEMLSEVVVPEKDGITKCLVKYHLGGKTNLYYVQTTLRGDEGARNITYKITKDLEEKEEVASFTIYEEWFKNSHIIDTVFYNYYEAKTKKIKSEEYKKIDDFLVSKGCAVNDENFWKNLNLDTIKELHKLFYQMDLPKDVPNIWNSRFSEKIFNGGSRKLVMAPVLNYLNNRADVMERDFTYPGAFSDRDLRWLLGDYWMVNNFFPSLTYALVFFWMRGMFGEYLTNGIFKILYEVAKVTSQMSIFFFWLNGRLGGQVTLVRYLGQKTNDFSILFGQKNYFYMAPPVVQFQVEQWLRRFFSDKFFGWFLAITVSAGLIGGLVPGIIGSPENTVVPFVLMFIYLFNINSLVLVPKFIVPLLVRVQIQKEEGKKFKKSWTLLFYRLYKELILDYLSTTLLWLMNLVINPEAAQNAYQAGRMNKDFNWGDASNAMLMALQIKGWPSSWENLGKYVSGKYKKPSIKAIVNNLLHEKDKKIGVSLWAAFLVLVLVGSIYLQISSVGYLWLFSFILASFIFGPFVAYLMGQVSRVVERKEFSPNINKINIGLAGLQGLIALLYPPSVVLIVIVNCLYLKSNWKAKVKYTGEGFYFQLATIILSGAMIALLPNLEVTRTVSSVFLFLALLGTYWNTLREKKQRDNPWVIGIVSALTAGIAYFAANPSLVIGLAVAHVGLALYNLKERTSTKTKTALQSFGFITGAAMIVFFLTRSLTFAAVGAILIFVSALSVYSFGRLDLAKPEKFSGEPRIRNRWKTLRKVGAAI